MNVQPARLPEIANLLAGRKGASLSPEVREGLTTHQKFLPCKYFYDGRGSELFERICTLPEYYQTRTELSILRSAAAAIMGEMREGNLVELGSGANHKIRVLLDAANGTRRKIRYVPVDVCEPMLKRAAADLLARYPELAVFGIVADFTRDLDGIDVAGTKLIMFFGSTIGNFSEEDCIVFLRSVARSMTGSDRFLVGVDMVKDRGLMEAAYNDRQGITAQFNKNILNVINRELHADFDLSFFDHVAFYNDERECIEMHLKANRDVSATVADINLTVTMKKGETIFTEICRKFSRERLEQAASAAGLEIKRWFSDPREWFSLVEMTPADSRGKPPAN
jgi:L-histidine N-alpha-methyltransferase